MAQRFEGRTVDAEAPFLPASWWKDGYSVKGTIVKIFDVEMPAKEGQPAKKSKCYTLDLDLPTDVDGEELDRVSVGNMAGIQMALSVMKRDTDGKTGTITPQLKDVLEIVCEGVKPAKKQGYSDRVNFHLVVTRP